jgi:four helix bundle protein
MSGRISRFEDLIAWQKARVLAAEVYKVTRLKEFSADFSLRDQMRRAVVSGMSNIAEGFERGKPAEFQHFLSITKASCAELRSQLYVAQDAGYVDAQTFDSLHQQADEVGRIVGGLRVTVERRRDNS